MKIDIFNHFFPERFFDEFINVGSGGGGALKRVQNVQTLTDLDARFRLMDEFGELRQVLSLASPPHRGAVGGTVVCSPMRRVVESEDVQVAHRWDAAHPR